MLVSMGLGLAAGMKPAKVLTSMQAGVGDALSFIAVVVGLGAIIGRFLQYSGGGARSSRLAASEIGPQPCTMGRADYGISGRTARFL